YDDLEKVCLLDKRFNTICDEYVAPTIKKLITDDLINVNGINSTIKLINIYKTIKINKRIIKLYTNKYSHDQRYAIVRSDGKILIKNILSEIDSDKDDSDDLQYEHT